LANREALIRQADLSRILKAFMDAGIAVTRTEIQNGKVVVYTEPNEEKAQNPWDNA
jgi:hypothetical protein